jgi:uncharacterized damage-inducible protein DinB
MREIDRILDQLQRAYDGDAWYGPSLRDALDDLEPAQAIVRVAPHVHTIWEIVLHVTAWTREITRRLQIGNAQDPADGDWPAAPTTTTEATQQAWDDALYALDMANTALIEAIRAQQDDRLDTLIGDVRDRALGSGVSRYVNLHGLVQHYAYHAGQIALLKKAITTHA